MASITTYKKIIFPITILAILIGGTFQCIAATNDSITVATVYFKQGSSKVEISFGENAVNLINAASSLDSMIVSRIIIVGSASPEGGEEPNMRLSRARAIAVANYLKKHIAVSDSVAIIGVGENWPLLHKMIQNDTAAAYRKPLLDILNSNRSDATKQKSIAALDAGRVLQKLMHNVYPKLRKAVIYAYEPMVEKQQETSIAHPDSIIHSADTILDIEPIGSVTEILTESLLENQKSCPDSRFAIKTNTLYWLALTPNIEAEYFIAPQWSVNGEFQYGWWANTNRHHYWRIAAGGAEMRYWLSPDKGYFNGHFIGAYLSGGIYEFMFRSELGIQGEVYVSGGLTYGYSLPLGCRFAMEFSLGIGYLNTLYREYHWNEKCYQYDQSKRLNYLGLTKAKISLIWRIGKGGAKK